MNSETDRCVCGHAGIAHAARWEASPSFLSRPCGAVQCLCPNWKPATPAPPACALCAAPTADETMGDYVDRHYGLPLHPLCACGVAAQGHRALHPHGYAQSGCPEFRAREETA